MAMLVTHVRSVTARDSHRALSIQNFYWGSVTKTWLTTQVGDLSL